MFMENTGCLRGNEVLWSEEVEKPGDQDRVHETEEHKNERKEKDLYSWPVTKDNKYILPKPKYCQ